MQVPIAGLDTAQVEPDSALAALAGLLRDHYKLLAGLSALGALLGYAYAAVTTPVYRATATIEVQDLNENFLNLKEVASATPGVSELATYKLNLEFCKVLP